VLDHLVEAHALDFFFEVLQFFSYIYIYITKPNKVYRHSLLLSSLFEFCSDWHTLIFIRAKHLPQWSGIDCTLQRHLFLKLVYSFYFFFNSCNFSIKKRVHNLSYLDYEFSRIDCKIQTDLICYHINYIFKDIMLNFFYLFYFVLSS
jgi:hypothetical protein